MADDESDKDPSDHLATGSGQLVDGIAVLSSGVRNISVSVWEWFGNHPVVKWPLLVVMGHVLMQYLILPLAGWIYESAFGTVTPFGGDISVTTTALPLGVSVNLLFLFWFLTAGAAMWRFVKLRQRIEQLEQQNV